MATVIFDTYKAVSQLRAAGFDESQAAAMVSTMCDVLGGNLANREVVALQREIATKEDFAALSRDLESKPDKADLRAMETRLTIRMGGMIFGAVGLVLAILRLFPDFFG